MCPEKLDYLTVSLPHHTSDFQQIIEDAILKKALDEGKEILVERSRLRNSIKYSLASPAFYKIVFYALYCSLYKSEQRLPEMRYNGIRIGEYIAAEILKDVKVNFSFARFLARSIKFSISGALMYCHAKRLSQISDAAYIRDNAYLGGIQADVFLREGLICYLKFAIFGVVKVQGSNFQQKLIPRYFTSTQEIDLFAASQYITQRLEDPRKAVHYYNVSAAPTDLSNIEPENALLIYTHSAFFDAQLLYGYAGFFGVYDWLYKTLSWARSAKFTVVVKGHPNRIHSQSLNNSFDQDIILWNRLKRKFQAEKFHFIESSMPNADFLDYFDKDSCLAVSHHGSAIIEAATLGFACLSSCASPWGEEYNIGHTAKDANDYRRVLVNQSAWKKANAEDVLRFIATVWNNPYGSLGTKFWQQEVASELDVSRAWIQAHSEELKIDDAQMRARLVNKACKSIQQVNNSQ